MAYIGHNGRTDTSKEVMANISGIEVEYNMPRSQFNAIANTQQRGKNDPTKYVIDTLNATGNLMGKVVKLNIEEEPIHIIHVDEE